MVVVVKQIKLISNVRETLWLLLIRQTLFVDLWLAAIPSTLHEILHNSDIYTFTFQICYILQATLIPALALNVGHKSCIGELSYILYGWDSHGYFAGPNILSELSAFHHFYLFGYSSTELKRWKSLIVSSGRKKKLCTFCTGKETPLMGNSSLLQLRSYSCSCHCYYF